MNLPMPVTKNSYNIIQEKLLEQAIDITDDMLDNSAKTLYEITAKNNPENIVEYSNKKYARVAVTVNGTWMKQGHQSKLGAVFVQSVETGEVLDYAVKSLFCHVCVKKKEKLSERAGTRTMRLNVLSIIRDRLIRWNPREQKRFS